MKICYYIRLLFAFALLLTSKKNVAQFNDSTHYYLRLASTGIINQAEGSKSYVLSNAASFSINNKKTFFTSSASYVYGKQNSTLTNNDFSCFANMDYLKDTRKFYYWALINFDKSYSLKITNRLQAGGGVAYNIVRNKATKQELIISDGFLFETSNLYDAKTGQDIYQTVRNSFRLKYHFTIKEILVLDGNNFFQPSIADISDYNIKSTNTLSVKLNKWLLLTASQTYNKVNRTSRKNLLLTFGIAAEKYF